MILEATRIEQLIKQYGSQQSSRVSGNDLLSIAKSLGISASDLLGLIGTALLQADNVIGQLEYENGHLKAKVYVLENQTNHKVTQQEILQNGIKIARKHGADIELINSLSQKGYTDDQIASYLGVSRSTIWRRRKEAEVSRKDEYRQYGFK